MGKATEASTQRNNLLFKTKELGATFSKIAEAFDITETRAKQIYYRELKKRGLKPRRYRKV